MEVREPSVRYLLGSQRTELGDLPADWTVASLGQFEPFVTSGSRGWAAHYSDIGSTFLRITNLSRSRIYPSLNDLRYVAVPPGNSEGIRTALRFGDLLVSITADIGIVGLVTEDIDLPAYVNQHIALVRFANRNLDSRYIAYFLAGASAQRRFKSMTDAGAKAGMNLAGVRDILAAIPPTMDEQHAIADALTDADALIASLEQLLIKKQKIKQGAMQELFKPSRLTHRTLKLEQVSSFITKGATPTTYGFGWTSEGIVFLRSECVSTNGLDLAQSMFISKQAHEALGRSAVSVGDLLMTITGNVGRVARATIECNINQHIARIRIIAPEINPDFVYYQLSHDEVRKELESITTGQAYPQLSLKQVRERSIRLPERAEQDAIATMLSDMDKDITATESSLTKARALKQAMAQALLTGRIRLMEPTT
jgi:type I restriction enzyme S subunit